MRLEIEGAEYPVDVRQSIAIDYDATETADVESGRKGRRVKLSLPSTPETDRLFGNADDVLTAERFNASHHYARLRADGTTIFGGTISLLSARKADGGVRYEAEIVGGSTAWAKLAAARDLSQAGVEFATALTPAEICKSWTSDTPVKFLPVHRDRYELTNSSVSLLPAEKILLTDDYHPFISAYALLNAIFADAGYEVESAFAESGFFRSLYISGAYETVDAAGRKRAMDFLAGRLSDATATADYFGRVYASASVAANTVGNIVETADPITTDADGRAVSSGFFSTNGCFGFENGVAVFRPAVAAKVAFEYSIAYATDHTILSRTRLRGFDTLYLGGGMTVPFEIANRYEDRRTAPLPSYGYKLMIFAPESGYVYRLVCRADSANKVVATNIKVRMTAVTMPAASAISDLQLQRAHTGNATYADCDDDWALYDGYIEETGRTEVELVLRTPSEDLSPTSCKRFNEIYFGGAERGMSLTLLRRTTLRPIFTSVLGYGSQVKFADVARHGVKQSVFLSALQQMFNLRFLTDEAHKKVCIEPYDDFYAGGETDWSDRTDFDDEVVISDTAGDVDEVYTLGYCSGDGTVKRFETAEEERFGRWSREVRLFCSKEGERVVANPMFAPTLNADGGYATAQSALIMQVCDRDVEDDAVSPRIVRFAGMHPLPEGERWGYPSNGREYPLAAFHFAGDAAADGFTLCFEDRDGQQGLHAYYDRQLAEEAAGPEVTLSLRLEPNDIADLLAGDDDGTVSVRSLFRIDTGGRTALYMLRSIDGYDPAKRTTRCTFLKTSSGQ